MLKGTLDDFTLPDVFRLTSHAKKTGRLEVERRNGSGRVYFRDGDVYYAESTKSKEPLGHKLIRSGWITEDQLQSAIEENQDTGRRVGEILIGQELVNEDQIEWAVKSQIEDGVFDLLRWDLGAFVWEPDVEIEVEVPLAVTVENLIIEASRRLDEITEIKKIIPSPDVVLVMAPRPPHGSHQINITPEEWLVLVLVDGRRSVSDIATLTGVDAYQTTRLLFGLMNAGLIINKERTQRGVRSEDSEGSEDNVVELQSDRPGASHAPPPPPGRESESETEETEPAASEYEQEEPATERPAQPPPPSPTRSSGPRVDRSAVVRELAGLFSDEDKPRPRAVRDEDESDNPRPAPPAKRRVEDDDQVDRKRIGRMIDGVRGL